MVFLLLQFMFVLSKSYGLINFPEELVHYIRICDALTELFNFNFILHIRFSTNLSSLDVLTRVLTLSTLKFTTFRLKVFFSNNKNDSQHSQKFKRNVTIGQKSNSWKFYILIFLQFLPFVYTF